MRLIPVIALFLFLLAGPSFADPFDAAQSAFDKGHYEAAFNIWKKLADGGDAAAQDKIGWMYESAYGVTRDEAEAMKWYQKAAAQGNTDAGVSIGEMYHEGKGVKKDLAEALTWYRKAAEQGGTAAAITLSEMYNGGDGLERDYSEALFWAGVARKSGLGDVVTMADTMRSDYSAHLTAEQIKAVDKRVKEWHPTPPPVAK
jgi:hypothetical protein